MINQPPNLTNLNWLNQVRTLANAYTLRPPTQYVVEKLFALPSLSICYGPPGSLKSMLLADMAICVAGGINWLSPAPCEPKPVSPFKVLQSPVIWVDFDNGQLICDGRFEALGRQYGLPQDAPFYYFSFPSPPLNATRPAEILDLIELVNYYQAGLVIIENLISIAGGRDENQSEIMDVITSLRLLAEKTKSAVVISTHLRKASGFKGNIGDSLRGYSGINGAIDRGLLIIREPGTEIVTINSEKTRGVGINPFGAELVYSHKPGTDDFETARFFQIAVTGSVTDVDVEEQVIATITLTPSLNKTKLIKEVKEFLKIGETRVEHIIKTMVHRGKIKETHGLNNSKLYNI